MSWFENKMCVYFKTTGFVNKPGVGGLWSNKAIFCLSSEDLSDTIFSSSSNSPNPLSIVLVDLAELSRSDLAESEFEVILLWLPCKLSPCDCFTWIILSFVVSCAVILCSCVFSSGDDFRFSFTSVGIGTTTLDALEAEQPMFERELQYNKACHVKISVHLKNYWSWIRLIHVYGRPGREAKYSIIFAIICHLNEG